MVYNLHLMKVAPRAGAWIEMYKEKADVLSRMSPLAQGRGLK